MVSRMDRDVRRTSAAAETDVEMQDYIPGKVLGVIMSSYPRIFVGGFADHVSECGLPPSTLTILDHISYSCPNHTQGKGMDRHSIVLFELCTLEAPPCHAL